MIFILGVIFDGNDYTSLVTEDEHNYGASQRIWVALLTNGIFFFFISLAVLFFMALQYAAEVSWSVVFKRVYEAMLSGLPLMVGIIILIIAVGQFDGHHIYHWQHYDASLTDGMDGYDHLLDHKSLFFHPLFYYPVLFFFMGAFIWVARYYRKQSLLEDQEGGTRIHFKNFAKSALFLVIFGYGSSVISWH